MEKTRVTLSIQVDLDPVPGTFHTKEDAVEQVQRILHEMIPHYRPLVINVSE